MPQLLGFFAAILLSLSSFSFELRSLASCSNDMGCPLNYTCQYGRCQIAEPCDLDQECADPTRCINRVCSLPVVDRNHPLACSSALDCEINYICKAGMCTTGACIDALDCPRDMYCKNSQCFKESGR